MDRARGVTGQLLAAEALVHGLISERVEVDPNVVTLRLRHCVQDLRPVCDGA